MSKTLSLICNAALAGLAASMLACSGPPPVMIERAWGTGGVEMVVGGQQVTVMIEEAGHRLLMDGEGDPYQCTLLTFALGPLVWMGALPEPLSDSRCFTEIGYLPFDQYNTGDLMPSN